MSTNGNGNGGRLTGMQRAFVDAWFGEAKFNGTEAARIAGYSGGDAPERQRDVWAVAASQVLASTKVRAEIERRWAIHGMGPNEVIGRLADQARGDITKVMKTDVPGGMLDMDGLKEYGHLVKSISWTKSGVRVELYDAQRAQELIGKHFGLFKDVTDVNITGLDRAIERELERMADPGQGAAPGAAEAEECCSDDCSCGCQ